MVLPASFKENSAFKRGISMLYYDDLISSTWVHFEITSLFGTFFLFFLEFILTEVLF